MITQQRTYQSVILANSPVNYWRLNDTGSSAVDLGSAAKNGTFVGSGITANAKGVFCPVDNGNSRGILIPRGSGAENYVQIASVVAASATSLRNGPWTFECWVRPKMITSAVTLYSRVDGANQVTGIGLNEVGGVFQLYLNANWANVVSTTTGITDLNQWHHIAVVSTDDMSATGELIFYLDGVALTNGTYTAPPAGMAGNTSNIQLGPGYSQGCVLSEVAIYSTALSAGTVQAHYKAANVSYRPRFKPIVGLHGDTVYEGNATERTNVCNNHGADGAKVTRHTLLWSLIEPTSGATKDWSRHDDVLTKDAAAGCEPMFFIYGSPTWANGGASAYSIPTNGAAFTTFVGKVVTFMTAAVNRYKTAAGGRPRVSRWEIWNEPNFDSSWNPTPSAAQYVEMSNAVRTAILTEDPTAEVAVASLGGISATNAPSISGITFFESCLTAGTPLQGNIFSIHNYNENAVGPKVSGSFNNNFSDIWTVLDMLKANGRLDAATKIWITEFGWNRDYVSEANQALYVQQGLAMLRDYYAQWVEIGLVFCDISDTGGRLNFGIRGTASSYSAMAARAEVLRYGTN